MKSLKQHINEETVKESVGYHVHHGIPLSECIFRPHSEGFYRFYVEARNQYNQGILEVTNSFDQELLESNIGERAEFNGETIPLDIPLTEEVELNQPKRGGPKKFFVYVKDPSTGNIKKVTFGDTTGKTAKINNPEARKSFAARHQCALKKDKTAPGYWACRLPYYAKQLGLDGGGNFFW